MLNAGLLGRSQRLFFFDGARRATRLVMAHRSRQTTYSYNRAGWRTGETWVSGSYTATYGYDNAGEMTAASDTNSTYTFTYYNDGTLNKTAVSYPGLSGMGTVTLTYSYDGYGNRTSLADSATGSGSITYSYNSNFQLTALNFSGSSTTASMSFSYGNSGRTHDLLTTITMVGGSDTITAAYSYDFHNRLTTIAYSDGAGNTLPTLGYTWNSDNQLTQFTSPQGTLTYAYDNAGQLTAVTGSESYTYGYDSNGNRNTTGYTTTTGNQMSADPTYTSITYDANGNLTSKGNGTTTFTYTWDYRNRLTKVVATGGTSFTETLTYDVFGNEIGMTHSGGDSTPNHWTVYDGANPYIDFNGTGTLTTRYLTNPQAVGQMFGRVTSGGTASWYLTDLEGSVREIIDKNGNVLDQTIKYDPFGQVTSESTPANGDRFKFQGGEWDSNLKLYRFGARWNDPAEGRWISQDPLGFDAGDSNLYRYVFNAPTYHESTSGMLLEFAPGGLQPPTNQQLPEKSKILEISAQVIKGMEKKPYSPKKLPGGGKYQYVGACALYAFDMAAALNKEKIAFKLHFYKVAQNATYYYPLFNKAKGKIVDIPVMPNATVHVVVEVKVKGGVIFLDAGIGLPGSMSQGNLGNATTGLINPAMFNLTDIKNKKKILTEFDPTKGF